MKIRTTIYLTEKNYEILRKMSYVSRKTQTALVTEAILLLAKTPGKDSDG